MGLVSSTELSVISDVPSVTMFKVGSPSRVTPMVLHDGLLTLLQIEIHSPPEGGTWTFALADFESAFNARVRLHPSGVAERLSV
jgi:hypothetical protein